MFTDRDWGPDDYRLAKYSRSASSRYTTNKVSSTKLIQYFRLLLVTLVMNVILERSGSSGREYEDLDDYYLRPASPPARVGSGRAGTSGQVGSQWSSATLRTPGPATVPWGPGLSDISTAVVWIREVPRWSRFRLSR